MSFIAESHETEPVPIAREFEYGKAGRQIDAATRIQGPMTDPIVQSADEAQLAALIVKSLNLETDPAAIDPVAPLYGEGLGLDSIDMLEIALAVSQTYGVKLKSDDKDNTAIFASLRALNEHIQELRKA
jgi:acyl carrier protein